MRIVPPSIINGVNSIIINIHPSLLPLHKGLHGAKKSYSDDSIYGGASVHYVTEELDSGDIIVQKKIDKRDISTFDEYCIVLKDVEFNILPFAIKKVLFII
jgi:phosphoribosylglycinamide formyltransferase-1